MRRPRDVGVADRGPGEVDLAQRGAGEVDAAEGGAAEGIGVVVVGRHPGIVAETSDGGRAHRTVNGIVVSAETLRPSSALSSTTRTA